MRLLCLLWLAAVTLFGQTSHPDFTGIWSPSRASGPTAPAPPTPIAVKPAFKPAYDALQKKIRDASARGEQYAIKGLCSPYGMPTMMQVAVYPMEVLQSEQQVTLIGEAFSEVRRVYIGKPQMPLDDVSPGWYGRSVAKWEGDTLVIDTIGVKDTVPGYQNLPHSDQMRITERLRRPTQERLDDQITITDPVTLEKPVVYTLVYRLTPGYEMVEFVCDNNREYIDENGIVRMKLEKK